MATSPEPPRTRSRVKQDELQRARNEEMLKETQARLEKQHLESEQTKKFIEVLKAYPDQLVSEVKNSFEVDHEEVRKEAMKKLQPFLKTVTIKSSGDSNQKQQYKEELQALEWKRQIEEDVLERSRQQKEKCVDQLKEILIEVQKKLRQLSSNA